MKKRICFCLGVALLIVCLLNGCGNHGGETVPSTGLNVPEDVKELAIVVDETNIGQLEDYPGIEKLDLTGSSCYAAIREYMAAHPEVEVTYTISVGGSEYPHDTAMLSLYPGDFDYERLLENLAYFSRVQSLSLPKTDLTGEQLAALAQTYPEVAVAYTVQLGDKEFPSDAAAVDLNGLQSADVESAAAKLALLPGLSSIDLSGSTLTPGEVKALRAGAPNADIDYAFELFGREVNLLESDIVYRNEYIGDTGEEALRQALDILAPGTRICFDDCGFTNEVMASVREDYPDHKVVWRVYFGEYFNMLTDEETVRAIFDLNNGNAGNLKYCTEVKYMDIGHNTNLSDVSFIANMTKLEICIMSGSPFSDMSVFANCPNLEWLELVWCGNVSDISVLGKLQNLKYLNLTYTQVIDVSMLGSDIPLERFFYARPKLTDEQIAEFEKLHPDCWCTYKGFEYGYGWRYDDPKTTVFSEAYKKVYEVFRYDENFYNSKRFG